MTVNQYANMQVKMTSGNANGLYKTIIANDATSFTFGNDWSDNARNVTISPGDTYIVQADTDKIWFMLAGTSALYQYSIDNTIISTGPIYDAGLYRDIAFTGPGLTTGSSTLNFSNYIANTIYPFSISAQGTKYNIGDILAVNGGNFGYLLVTSVNATGGVLGVSLICCGSSYSISASFCGNNSNSQYRLWMHNIV